MQDVRRGDLGGLAALFERHHRPLFQFFVRLSGNRDLSEDMVQEVFFRVLKYRDTFQPDRPFTAWMYQIARNTHMDAMRKRRFEVIRGGEAPDPEPVSGDEGVEDKLGRKQEVALLRRALDSLPADKRELLVLSRFQNLKYEEIASVLNCEVGAVKVRVYRAVRALSEIYSQLAKERAC